MRRIHPRKELKSWSTKHTYLLNYILLNPFASVRELAEVMGFSRAWISTVRNSERFRSRLQKALPQIYSIPIDEFHDELVKRSLEYGRENATPPESDISYQRRHG